MNIDIEVVRNGYIVTVTEQAEADPQFAAFNQFVDKLGNQIDKMTSSEDPMLRDLKRRSEPGTEPLIAPGRYVFASQGDMLGFVTIVTERTNSES